MLTVAHFFYKFFLKPFLFHFEFMISAETSHRLISFFANLLSFLFFAHKNDSQKLGQTLAGIYFPNPIGLAAGFDKNAENLKWLPKLGFGFLEVGSVTHRPGEGNKGLRLIRLKKEKALFNRMGLNNYGAAKVAARIKNFSRQVPVPVGISLAKTHDPILIHEQGLEDFVQGYKAVCEAGDYTAINLSCPNTSEGKTFEEDPLLLKKLLELIIEHRSTLKNPRPMFLKISPELHAETLKMIMALCYDLKIEGLIIANTRPTILNSKASPLKGGLSGAPLAAVNLKNIRLARELADTLDWKTFVIIGCGGIMNPQDAQDMLSAGANLVQLYTGLIYQGPNFIESIKTEIMLP